MKWEYRVEKLALRCVGAGTPVMVDAILNKLGEEGWEAITSWTSIDTLGEVFVLLKREKSK